MKNEKIIEYYLIREDTRRRLRELVIKGIAEDMQPYGSPFMDGNYFCQAMVKYKE